MSRINITLAKEKGLIGDNDLKYQELARNYKYLLEYYLNSSIDFKKYEKEIDDSNLFIGKTDKYRELNEFLKLDYLYLISDLYIEKLDKTDLDKLSQLDRNNIDDNLLEIVKKTYKEVILNNYLEGKYTDKPYKVCYGAATPTNFVNNDSLVFSFYYGRNILRFVGKELIKLDQKQREFIEKEMELLKKEIFDKLNVNCEILIKKDIEK